LFGVIPLKIIKWIKKNNINYYLNKYVNIDKSVTMGNGCVIYGNKYNVVIGKDSYINEAQIFAGKNSIIKIGQNCSIGYRVSIKSSTHSKNKIFHDSESSHEVFESNIEIGDRCWIGDGVFIKEGVIIGNDVIVGANSVVTKSFTNNVIIGGIPAKILRYRK